MQRKYPRARGSSSVLMLRGQRCRAGPNLPSSLTHEGAVPGFWPTAVDSYKDPVRSSSNDSLTVMPTYGLNTHSTER